jgi:UDP-N-acetyl-D-mannosaminuronic acid dehydrogenase
MKIAVIGGAGHVGLPLSLVLADAGHSVKIIDINQKALSEIQKGIFPFLEKGGPELLKEIMKTSKLSFSSDHKDVKDCEVIILTVGTPVDEHLNPDLASVYSAINEIKNYLNENQVLIFRSTLFPGTSEKIKEMLSSEGINIGISFCPERIAQGYALEELHEFPQIISGSNEKALNTVRILFADIASETITLDLAEAEIAKLITNTWRYINFSIANQFYMILEEKGFDFYKIKDAISKNYPRAVNFPNAGFAAGPCLFKDTMQLAAFNRHNFTLGHSAMLVNETLPDFLVEKVKRKTTLSGKKVGILGMAFKPNNDDNRESLAYKLKRLLTYENAIVLCTDPHIEEESFLPVHEVIEMSEIIFIGCPHKEYDSLTIKDKTVINCWG